MFYRRAFTATAVLEHGALPTFSKKVEFVLEHSPLGPMNVSVQLLEDIDYPVLPAIQAIRAHVEELESAGRLP